MQHLVMDTAMTSSRVLPKQLQYMLKQSAIPIAKHEMCLQDRAVSQMTEYLKILNMRTGTQAEASEEVYNLSDLLGFVNSQQESPRVVDASMHNDELL
jgi:hypothetical protein